MAQRVLWRVDPGSAGITEFQLQKSVDAGNSYTALVTIPFDLNGANYEKQAARFFYDDAGGGSGHVYLVYAVGPNGTSDPIFFIPPPSDPQRCAIIGYVLDVFGNADQSVAVEVNASTRPSERWHTNPTGLVAREARALGILPAAMRVYPDANGIWQVSLVRKAFARISIPALDFEKDIEVPDAIGPFNIVDVPGLTGTDASGIFQGGPGLRASIPRA